MDQWLATYGLTIDQALIAFGMLVLGCWLFRGVLAFAFVVAIFAAIAWFVFKIFLIICIAVFAACLFAFIATMASRPAGS